MDYYEVQGQIDDAVRSLRSDVEYYADNRAQEARSDAQHYAQAMLDEHSTDNHISFEDLRQGLSEAHERISELEQLICLKQDEVRTILIEKGILSDA